MVEQNAKAPSAWMGEHWGRSGTLAYAEEEYPKLWLKDPNAAAVMRASAWYSAMTRAAADIKTFRVWKVYHFLRARSTLLAQGLLDVDYEKLNADQAETLSRVLYVLGRVSFGPVSKKYNTAAWYMTVTWNLKLQTGDAKGAQSHTGPHLGVTWCLSYIHKEKGKFANWKRGLVLGTAERVKKSTPFVEDPNQRARVYRGLAKVYKLLGEQEQMGECLKLMNSVRGIGSDVVAKNEAV